MNSITERDFIQAGAEERIRCMAGAAERVSSMAPSNTGPLAATLAPAFSLHHPVPITAH